VWDCAQMVITLKLSGLAIGYSDGAIPDEKKTPVQLKVQVKKLPSIIAFLGKLLFFKQVKSHFSQKTSSFI
jgi:lysophospholipid acyltransferase